MVQLKELEKLRDRTLASLRLGKQAPGYKVAKQVIDRFIEQLLLRGRVASGGDKRPQTKMKQGL